MSGKPTYISKYRINLLVIQIITRLQLLIPVVATFASIQLELIVPFPMQRSIRKTVYPVTQVKMNDMVEPFLLSIDSKY